MFKWLVTVLCICSFSAMAQQRTPLRQGLWRAELHRKDGKIVAFQLLVSQLKGKWQLSIVNATEKIPLTRIVRKGDSLNFALPVFESEFRTQIQPDGSLKGSWFKGTATQTQEWLFTAFPNKAGRFDATQGNASENVSGRWAFAIDRPSGGTRPAVAELQQKGNRVTGTVLTPSGDYRFMEGIVSGKQFELSVFDGAHAFYFNGQLESSTRMSGYFYSGYAGADAYKAEKNPRASLPETGNAPTIKGSDDRLNFAFKDIDGNTVSITDERFKNKVVVIQIMGSWCPNCLDETKFLSAFYKKNKQRGVEMLSLAYENSTDYERSRASLEKFRKLYNVEYPMLVTGVWVNDSLRTEKTIPQITPIKAFPSTIFLGRDGRIKKMEAGFNGPGTGIYHEVYKKEFEELINKLLSEKY